MPFSLFQPHMKAQQCSLILLRIYNLNFAVIDLFCDCIATLTCRMLSALL